ncbi:MAG: orotidine-5'-phosphate decarboxylase [Nitriliruptoraceae bacterium]
MSASAQAKLAVALDVEQLERAVDLARSLQHDVGCFKVGLELFSAYGPEAVRAIRPYGDIFLDVKLHDIPTTVGRATRQLAALGISLMTVHASGGPAMVAAAAEAFGTRGRVLAVTVLTSISAQDRERLGIPDHEDHVPDLAELATDHGASGIVCSVTEAPAVRARIGHRPLVVTPGIRPTGFGTDDHATATTPTAAIDAGSDLLVVGRPITQADDPRAAAQAIVAELDAI